MIIEASSIIVVAGLSYFAGYCAGVASPDAVFYRIMNSEKDKPLNPQMFSDADMKTSSLTNKEDIARIQANVCNYQNSSDIAKLQAKACETPFDEEAWLRGDLKRE
jgi:hypothetical protein